MPEKSSSQQAWTPPLRPEWVKRINEEGDCMDIAGIVPLDENSLLETAMRNTGLSDFGEDNWREPFRLGIKALQDEAQLNLVGRLRARQDLLLALEARLRIEDTYRRHPEIEDEQIVKPIMVIGQGRSGTSFLINALAADPDNGACLRWEMMFPCPPPEQKTYRSDPRIAKADKLAKQWVRITPEMAMMHEFAGDLPLECAFINFLSFRSMWFGILGQVPSYAMYLMQQDPEIPLRYHRRVLKLLQWKNPRKRWVLKDIGALDYLEAELKVYPDMCFIWPHRDPVRALGSMINLAGTTNWIGSDQAMSPEMGMMLKDPYMSAMRLNTAIDKLEAGVVPAQQIHHLQYRDLVDDPMGSVDAAYQHFGITLGESGKQGIKDYLGAHPRDARQPHRFSPGSAEDIAAAREAYQRYQAYFGIPNED